MIKCHSYFFDKDNIKTRSYNTIDGYRAAELIFDNSNAELIAKDMMKH